ncbi:hypothetical protein ACGFJ7_24530 [Actinoplanes sp. NPDC048988]
MPPEVGQVTGRAGVDLAGAGGGSDDRHLFGVVVLMAYGSDVVRLAH